MDALNAFSTKRCSQLRDEPHLLHSGNAPESLRTGADRRQAVIAKPVRAAYICRMDWSSLATFVLVFALAAALPGPGIAAIVARALGSGAQGVWPMIAGFVVGDVFYLTAAVFGLAVVASQFGAVFAVIRVLGAIYLVYLGYRLWTAPFGALPSARVAKGSGWRLFLGGLSLTLGNPKVMAFYLALLPTVIDLEHLSGTGFAELVGVVVVMLSAILAAYVVLAARARALLAGEKARRVLNRTAGSVMIGAAAAIVVK